MPDWEKAPDARGQKSWDGVLQWIRSLDDRMDARLVGFGESEARAVNECEERAVAAAARAAATRGAVKLVAARPRGLRHRARRQDVRGDGGGDRGRRGARVPGRSKRYGRTRGRGVGRGAPARAGVLRRPAGPRVADARRPGRASGIRSRGETPKAWARATRHASDVRGDAYSRLDGDERSAAEAVPKLNDWLGHLRKVRAQFRAWPRGGPPEVAWAPGLFRPTAFLRPDPGARSVLVASSGAGGVRVSGLELSGGEFDNDMMTLRDGAPHPVTLRVRGGDQEDGAATAPRPDTHARAACARRFSLT